MSTKKKPAPKRRRAKPRRRWSREVTEHSDAMDLESGVFSKGRPEEVASSVKRSAERSRRRKSSPYRSAMSMLTFYINRAGKKLTGSRRRVLDQAKGKLRELFGQKKQRA